MSKKFSIINETKSKLPLLPFQAIKEACLGKDYSLTLVFALGERLKKLNIIYRDKNHSTDILSFPLSKKEGEIYISLADTKKEARKFVRTYENFLAFLFIHGCVHLKGHDHSSTMEGIEVELRNRFNI